MVARERPTSATHVIIKDSHYLTVIVVVLFTAVSLKKISGKEARKFLIRFLVSLVLVGLSCDYHMISCVQKDIRTTPLALGRREV